MVRGKFSMKNTRISLDAYKIEYIRRFGIRKITAQGRLSIHGQSPLSRYFSITMTAFLCTPKGDANGFKRREHADSKWCSQEELKGLDWAAADVGVVESIL